jgi:hypothetical protein
LGFEEGFAVSGEGMEEELAVGGVDQDIEVRGREEVIGGEAAGLVIGRDIEASDARVLRSRRIS